MASSNGGRVMGEVTEMTFYHNVRLDGGRRTGVTADGIRGLELFRPGPGDEDDLPDPRLAWSVTVTIPDDGVIATQEEVAEWLGRTSPAIAAALEKAAEDVPAGIDFGFRPWITRSNGLGRELTVTLSAMRVHDHQELGRNLHKLATKELAELSAELQTCLLSEA